MILKERIHKPEIMDTRPLSPTEMTDTLRFLSLTNRFFGGSKIVLRHLEKWSTHWEKNEPVTIVDIGCGAGDILIDIALWAQKKGFLVSLTGIDLVPEIVEIAKNHTRAYANISIECINFFDLIQKGRSFDYVIASLFLHHTHPNETTSVLKGMDQLARRGVLVSDLLRSAPSYVAVSACSYLLGNNVVRHDGPLSVRRSFRTTELNTLAHAAGLESYLKAQNEPWFRLSLSGTKTP